MRSCVIVALSPTQEDFRIVKQTESQEKTFSINCWLRGCDSFSNVTLYYYGACRADFSRCLWDLNSFWPAESDSQLQSSEMRFVICWVCWWEAQEGPCVGRQRHAHACGSGVYISALQPCFLSLSFTWMLHSLSHTSRNMQICNAAPWLFYNIMNL